jgi:hypothetical protein
MWSGHVIGVYPPIFFTDSFKGTTFGFEFISLLDGEIAELPQWLFGAVGEWPSDFFYFLLV